jgi:hypothetical protein
LESDVALTEQGMLEHAGQLIDYLRAAGAGSAADPAEVARSTSPSLDRGLSAEDEFGVICAWLGQCRLIRKLRQQQAPVSSRDVYQVPDVLATFARALGSVGDRRKLQKRAWSAAIRSAHDGPAALCLLLWSLFSLRIAKACAERVDFMMIVVARRACPLRANSGHAATAR